MMKSALKILSCPFLVLIGLTTVSVCALLAAFISEAFLGLEPCILCVYQRWPFAIVVALGISGIVLKKGVHWLIGLSGLTMIANSAIALYHSGVELHWWKSAVEGCAVPNFGDEPQSILENIMSAPTGNCAEIPWADPLLGLSMANYNVMLCLGLAVLCGVSLLIQRQAMSDRP